ncbi:hypothetical protein I317_01349 [Kwoniella heveanensis CBS 569]|nr:hypothetical protein I317_01349 [Kwoniella heveanensis CBS 569]
MTFTSQPDQTHSPVEVKSKTVDAMGSTGLGHIRPEALEGLSAESMMCLENFARYQTEPVADYGKVRQAAVLVALFQKEGDDKLHVLLTTRAKTLRRHPSQTALPGGKVDPEDPDVVHTARREAYEEVNLPLDHPDIHHLAILEPVMTILPLNALMRNHIIVTPVVCFISSPSLLEGLSPNPDEVDAIFTYPLKGCLTGTLNGEDAVGLSEAGEEWWPHEEEYHSTHDRIGATGGYRMHRFRTTRTPIKGLTSDVLIQTAMVAYGRSTSFDRYAPNQELFPVLIADIVRQLPEWLEKESLNAGSSKEVKVVEWGGTEGERYKCTETWATA